MSRDLASDLLARAKPAVLGLLLAAGLVAGALALVMRGGSPSRLRLSFPSESRLDAAIASAQEKLKADPQDLGALVDLGAFHFKKGKEFYADAINELEEARDLGALDARVFYCLGLMYQEVGLYPFALDEYRRYLRHYPEDKEIRMLTAKLLYKQGRYAEAVSDFERLKFRHPGDALVGENLGLSLWGAKEAARALETFELLRASGGPPAKRADYYIGQIHLEAGRLEQALEHLQRSRSQEDTSPLAIPAEKIDSALAGVQQRLGRLEEAQESWRRVLAAAPSDAKASAALREVSRRLAAKKHSSSKRK